MSISYRPHIGKNVIETLTLGMYEDARFVYREYIQNAADQIDVAVEDGLFSSINEGEIKITIDAQNKFISIEDNATGVKAGAFLRFLGDVANSEKDVIQRKGFRGIGRLGGLGYCERLVFETSYHGEKTKSIMTLDAASLRKIIQDRKDNTDAAGVISVITTVEHESEIAKRHYFKVCMVNVTNELILNKDKVNRYLTMVAPLPFHPKFKFASEVRKYFKRNKIAIDEYRVISNDVLLYKAYKNSVVDGDKTTAIIGVNFFKINDDSGSLLAMGWYGIRDYVNDTLTDHAIERGIRLRKSNIQIGGENALNRFFKAERTNFRFIGELHVLSPLLIPNARRDYFNDNRTCQIFDENLEVFFKVQDWENKLAQNASKIHNRVKDIQHYKGLLDEYSNVKEKIDSTAKENHYRDKITSAKDKAIRATKVLEKVRDKAEKDENIKTLYNAIISDEDLSFDTDIENLLKPKVYDPPVFAKLSESETDLVREIINLIYESGLSLEYAEILKLKIVQKYN